ncbi:MAG: hypothetical protein M1816_003311 [Peltula sp. TS41687]|nr:MAG: hypothetical protein M1816_003311 [Peltula sp. TS41687]
MAPSRSQKFYTKWSSDEINEIINWFAEADEQGNFPHVNQFIKGGTIAACQEILRATSLGSKEAITVEKLKDKINNLSKQYKAARDWLSNTGEGLRDDGVDEDTIKAQLVKRCSHYEKWDLLFGGKPTTTPPFTSDSQGLEQRQGSVVQQATSPTQQEDPLQLSDDDLEFPSASQAGKATSEPPTPSRQYDGVREAIVEAEKVRVEAQEKGWEKEEKQWEREEERRDQEHEEKMELLRQQAAKEQQLHKKRMLQLKLEIAKLEAKKS